METSENGTGGVKDRGVKPLTTFVHADTSTFRQVVQRLTGGGGSNQTQNHHANSIVCPGIGSRKPTASPSAGKLHERRQYMRPKLEIAKPNASSSHFKSSSPLVSPSTIFSKLSIVEQENKGGGSSAAASAESSTIRSDEEEMNAAIEEKAIQEKRFYLHPSPRRGKSPELLALFPLTSPKSNLQSP